MDRINQSFYQILHQQKKGISLKAGTTTLLVPTSTITLTLCKPRMKMKMCHLMPTSTILYTLRCNMLSCIVSATPCSTTTTMQQLHCELLACIFVHYVGNSHYLKPNKAQAPLLLMQVCCLWKELALQTKQLWCSLNAIEYDGWGLELEPMWSDRMNKYTTWLSRLGSYPLSLAIPFERDGHHIHDWLNTLLGHKVRFQQLWVVDEEKDRPECITGWCQYAQLPFSGGSAWRGLWADHYPTSPPSFHSLILNSLCPFPASLLGPAWANLTHLTVKLPFDERYSADQFLDLVFCCSNLHLPHQV